MATGTAGRVGAVLALVAASADRRRSSRGGRRALDGTSPGAQSTSPSTVPAADAGLRIEYRVLPVDGVAPGPDDLALVADLLRARLDATGVAASSVTPSGEDRVVVEVAVDPTDEAVASELRALLGATGRLDFVPLGATPVEEGQAIDVEQFRPIFSGDQVMDAAVGSDQTGQRTIDLAFGPEGSSLFADHTAAHIGEYFAIALDGTAISVPLIMDAIPDGHVQISQGGVGGFPLADAQRLVTISAHRRPAVPDRGGPCLAVVGRAQASSNSAWSSARAVIPAARARRRRIRAFQGGRSPGGDPPARDERANRRHAARADAGGLDDGHAGGGRALQGLDLAGRRVAGARAGTHDPAGAGRDGGIDQHAVRPW